ncbi:inverse autotransporter beta domain-containing protein [Photorhabdus asymbiotica]|uniref:inverse autotransporter beta domain-containing protein n=1 Tax=Photorhabdus asymbiotica TaxID=291112 RepID=UPI003DA721BB
MPLILNSYPALSESVKPLVNVENCQDHPEAVIKHDIDRKKQTTEPVNKKLHENITHKEKKRSEQSRCGYFLSKRSAIEKSGSSEKPKIPQLYENSHKDENHKEDSQNTPPLILSRGPEFLGLLNKDPKKLAQDYIVNKLNSQITSNTQKWLSQFGTAKINLNVDHRGRLDESSVDLLVPFYDDKDHWLVYSQYGYRHKDSRDTVNLGIGTRLFINDWMYGANTFYDNDLTGNNSRFSLGGELWTNYLKMSANAYFRLSDWHNSRDLTNYYERPANGYDLIADMYLPAMPSLGTKIKYEQYFGDNVALFGTNNRQKDPYAATIGVNYTPIPLITAGVDYKLGKEGKSDGIFSLNVNYRFGVPLSEQLSPENVGSLRSLAGSRYDLVERNNNIILNYLKKQKHFRLIVPVIEISGYGGEIKPIQIQSDTAFKNVTWDMPELFQKNGGIIKNTNGYTIQLPEYQPDGKNDYTITGTSKDDQQRVQIQTHVLQRNISLSVNTTDPLIADGEAKYIYTATLLGADKKTPIENAKLVWDTNQKDPGLKLKPDSEATDKNGQQTATLTSTTPLSGIQVSVSINGERVTTDKKVSFTEPGTSYHVTSVTVDKVGPLYNDGTDTYTFTATVKDGHGNLVVDKPIEIDWQTDPAMAGLKLTKQPSAVSNAQGQVTATLTSTAAVTDVQVSAKTTGQPTAVKAASKVSFAELSDSYHVTDVTVDKEGPLYNNGTDTYTFTATVKDGHGNLVVDKPIEIDWQTDPAMAGLKLTKQPGAVSNAQGQVTATLTSTVKVSDVQVSAKTASQPTAVKAASKVSFAELSDSYYVASVTVDVDKDEKHYNNGTDTYTFTATVKDGHGNLVVDKPIEIDWQTDPAVAGLKLTKQPGAVSNAQGQVTATLTSTAAVTDVQVSAKTASQQTAVKAASKVSFAELSTSYYVASVAVDVDKDGKRYNNGTDTYTFTATVKDGHGNLVVDKPIEIDWQTDPAVAGLKLTKQPSAVSNAQGQVTATLTSTAAVTDVQVSAKTASQPTAVKAESKVSFAELSDSYYVASVAVDVDKDGKRYNNGTDTYTFTATVKDGHGNLVVDQPIEIDWQTDPAVAGLKLTKQPSAVSNAQGQVTATLTSTAAVTDVQVSAKTASQPTAVKAASKVSFAELSTSYYVASVAVDVDKDGKRYNNGTDTYTFTATVKDGHGNLVVDQPIEIDWQTDPAVAGLKLTKQSNSVSNAQGQVTATLTSTTAVTDVQVSAKTASQPTAVKAASKVSFAELSTSYYVASVAVDVDKDGKRYNNGTDTYTFTATVKDGHGNLVVDQPIEIDWQTDPAVAGLKLTKQPSAVSNAQGQVTATLTSTAAVTDVQVSAKTASQPTAVKAESKVSFAELSDSYYVAGVAVDVDKDGKRYNNGTDTYTFTATVKDGHGNLVVDQPIEIDWQTDPAVAGLKLTKQPSAVSNAQGQVTATLTSTAAVTDVQVSAKTASQPTAVKAESKVSFAELSDSYHVTRVTVDKDGPLYNEGTDAYTFTATVEDAYGNLVVDKPIEIDWQTEPTVDGLKLTKQNNPVSNAQGQVTATLSSTVVAIDVQVSAKTATQQTPVKVDKKISFISPDELASLTVSPDHVTEGEGEGHTYTFTATVKDFSGQAKSGVTVAWRATNSEGVTITDKNLVTQVVGDGKTDADGKAQYQIYSKSGGFVAVMVTAKVNDSSVGSKNKTVEIKANEQDVTGFFILNYDPVDGKGYGPLVPKERMNFAWTKMQFVPEYLPGKLTIAGYTGVYDSNNRNIVDVDGDSFRVKKTGTVTLTATFTHPISGRYLKYIIPDVKIDHFVIIDSSPGGPGIGIVFSGDRIDNSKPLPRCTRGNRIQESDLGESIDYLVNNLNLNLIEKGLLGDPRRGLNANGVRMGGLQKNETSIQAHFLDNNVRNALPYSLAYVVLCEE